MLFNSYPFIFIFLPVTFVGTYLLGRFSSGWAICWLGCASLIFYAYWNLQFVTLLLGSIIFNYSIAQWIRQSVIAAATKRKSMLLLLGIIANLALLGYFKYTNFFIGSFHELLGMPFTPLGIILPLGISFFTFTQLAFIVDISLGSTIEGSFSRDLLFVTFFPHLIAGPLIHHKQMMPQFSNSDNFRLNSINISIGLTIFVLGLAKKVFIADNFGEIADPIFTAAQSGKNLQFFEAWVGALSYTLQLYFDFSAYSEMAIGLSLLFNIRLPLNFNSPYKAQSMIDFWQRWHMSLTKYIWEYLYTPITVSFMRKGLGRTTLIETAYTLVIPTLLTFVIIGLWHGANWTYIAFGTVHGLYLVVNHLWRNYKKRQRLFQRSRVYPLLACLLTYCAAVFAFVFFRADTITAAINIQSSMFGGSGLSLPAKFQYLFPDLVTHFGAREVVFDGVFPNMLFKMSNVYIASILIIGHCVVWGLPNVNQIMCRYQISTQDLALRGLDNRSRPAKFFSPLIWKATPYWAIFSGVLFFAIILAMSTYKPSAFLYYQF